MLLRLYDGANTVGGNKIYLTDHRHGVFLDFGLNFVEYNKYFKEFIDLSFARGIHDFLEMSLVPKVDIYRKDLYPLYLRREDMDKIQVDAVLISHAHADHFGLVGLLDIDIPIMASPETLALIKAYQDSGRTKEHYSVIYSVIREPYENEPFYKDTWALLKKKRIGNNKAADKYMLFRKLIPTEAISANFKEFITNLGTGSKQAYKTEVAKTHLKFGDPEELPWKIESYTVDHSIYGAVGFVIHTDSHKIAYTGDLRAHGERSRRTWEFVQAAKNSDVLIIEGTRVSSDKEHSYTEEKDVKENCSMVVSEYDGKIVMADFSSRNFERLTIFREIARENGRKLVITEKDAYAISGLLSAGTDIDTDSIFIYPKAYLNTSWWQKELSNSELWKDRYVNPIDIRESPGEYVLAFSLYDITNLLDIKPDGGVYIYSSTEAFTEEMELDFITLNNWLVKYGIMSVGFKIVDGRPVFERGYHSSGHATPEDIEKIIDIVDPDIIVPVHTEHPEWFSEKYGDKVKTGREIIF